MNKKLYVPLVVIPISIVIVLIFVTNTPIAKNPLPGDNLDEAQRVLNVQEEKPMPEMQIDESKKYIAVLETSEGELTIELTADKTPITVNNFVTLSKEGYYDGVIFHRVMKDFMVQTGDPTGTGRGGPGYSFDDEPFEGEYTRGTVAMANAGPNTNGSQFFIMTTEQPLPKNYVIFGKVIEGLDTLDKIANTPVIANAAGEMSNPVDPPEIVSIEIIEE